MDKSCRELATSSASCDVVPVALYETERESSNHWVYLEFPNRYSHCWEDDGALRCFTRIWGWRYGLLSPFSSWGSGEDMIWLLCGLRGDHTSGKICGVLKVQKQRRTLGTRASSPRLEPTSLQVPKMFVSHVSPRFGSQRLTTT